MKLELEALARCLQLPRDTLERWIRQGRIPVRKTDRLCDFQKDVLDAWARKHHIRFNLAEPQAAGQADSGPEKEDAGSLLSALVRGGFHLGLDGQSVEEVLKKAVALVPALSGSEQDMLFEKLMERERLTSTGIGKGVAIPHPRNPLPGNGREAMITACLLDSPVDFNSIDKKPVTVMFLMVCPSVKSHLFLLSRISFCLRDEAFIALVNSRPTADQFFSAIEALESRLGKG